MRLSKRSTILILALCVTAAGAAALGSHSTGAAPDNRIAYTSLLGHRPAISRTASPAEIVSAVHARYGGRGVVSASIGRRPSTNSRPGIWLHFQTAVGAVDQAAIRPQWEADLIEGAVADALAATDGEHVAGSTIDWLLPDGRVLPNMGGGMGDVVPGQMFSDLAAGAIKLTLKQRLAQAGLEPTSIEVLHADQPAPAVVATTNDPRSAARAAASTIRLLFGQDPPIFEGYYFEVRDRSGAPVFIQSAAFRSGAGRLWVRPSVEDVSTLNHG